MADPFLLRDALQLSMMIFAVGAFVNEARSTKKLVEQQAVAMKVMDGRVTEVEKVQLKQTALLDRTVAMLDKIDGKFDIHITASRCGEHEAGLRELRVEVNLLRGEVERLRDRVDAFEESK